MAQLSPDDVIPLHLADITFPSSHPLSGQKGEVFAFLIRHPAGLILFETGIGRGNDVIDRFYQVMHRPLETELERHGHRVEDVRTIVNSHLHFDHCGSNPMFPGVPIYVQSPEYKAARQRKYTVPDWVEFAGAEYAVTDGDAQIARGVFVLSTPGHSPGHQSLVVETRGGRVALAGQAVYSRAEYDSIRRTGLAPTEDTPADPDQYLASAVRLMDLQPRRVFFSHDRSVWNEGD